MRLLLCVVVRLLFASPANGQEQPYATGEGIVKPDMLPSHPLGLFISRINHSFHTAPPKAIVMGIDVGAANVWLPEVISYFPKDPATVAMLSQLEWPEREWPYRHGAPMNHDSTVFSADGVIRTIFLHARIRVTQRSELDLKVRGFLLTNGSPTFTPLINDAMIEGFHSNIWNDEDPFARKYYGFNKSGIHYQDQAGRTLQVNHGDFVLPGVQVDYHYYPAWKYLNGKKIYLNTGVHVGANTTATNRSIDLGLSLSAQRHFRAGKANRIALAVAGSVLRQKMITWGNAVDFSNQYSLPSLESQFEYRKKLKGIKSWALGLNFYYLGPYRPAADIDKVTPTGKRISTHWHLAYTELYRTSQNWTLSWSYINSYSFSVYVKEDLKVNNAPDIQTGVSLAVPITLKKAVAGN